MAGAVIIIVLLVVVIPVGILVTGGAAAGVIGHVLRRNAELTHEGSELIDLND